MFPQIEARRAAAGILQKDLCERAAVHETTYTARKSGRRALSETTLKKLETALEELIKERQEQLLKIGGAA
ncbi:helix-turn-helix domain-containing protein [Rhizobium halophilum]|uniref:helix-turn-helix domain-containing protein n=1 Tax=Rhizobium halophilum TaxID=2846852 RepID=UPI001EFEB7FB|nr:helix-turn-helix transcriptional regulator [Rhizobium halophilum]MCF6368313.1 helix-turn-helix domain-containing protein [Rhizobium halophilum]